MKSVLLASSVSIIALTSAIAADLPAKKAAPAAESENWSCPAFGAGFFKIPGGETCLRISGLVRSNNQFNLDSTSRGTAPYIFSTGGSSVQGRLIFDANSNSEIGAVGGTVRLHLGATPATDYAFVKVGDLTAGQFASMADIYGHFAYTRSDFLESRDTTADTGLMYRLGLGGGQAVTLGIVTAKTTTNGTASSRPDLLLGYSTTLAGVSFESFVANHEAAGATSGSYNGYAAGTRVRVPAGPARIIGTAAIASGASRYIITSSSITSGTTFKDADANSETASTANGSSVQVEYDVDKSLTLRGFLFNQSATGASGSTTYYKRTGYGVNSTITVAPGLQVVPELQMYQTETTSSGPTNTDLLNLRIVRNF